MADEPTNRKDELQRLLSNVESQADRLEALGQDVVSLPAMSCQERLSAVDESRLKS